MNNNSNTGHFASISDKSVLSPIEVPQQPATKFISPEHSAEWVKGSGVSEKIVRLCLATLKDRAVISQRLGWKRYPEDYPLGWWCSGLNLATMKPQAFGQFKPDTAIRLDPEAEKPAKYISAKSEYDAIALPNTDLDYWQKIIDDPSIPISVTEGPKKAGTLLTLDFPTLGLCGVTMGLKKGGKELVSNLDILAVQGRPITIVFDTDLAENINIQHALKASATVLKKKGCIVRVAVISQELNSKAIDDVFVNHGPEMVAKIMSDAIPYAQWLKNLEAQINDISASEGNTRRKSQGKDEETLADEIAERYRAKLAWHIPAQCWMRYEADSEGVWSDEPKEIVRGVVMAEIKAAKVSVTASLVSNVCTHLQSLLAVKRWDNAAEDLIPLKNGVYNFRTGKFSKHQSGHFLTWCLPYKYNILATCEPIVNWLEEAAGDKQISRLLIAYLKSILTGRTDIHRFLELVGPGGSGKSTYTRLAQALTGTENTHTTTLIKLEGSRFETACLWNKRLAIINDSERYGGNVTVLKAATGGDTIPHEVKFIQSSRGFVFDGKVILTCNEIIQSADYTSGLERRRITVPFRNRIPVENQRNLIEIKGDKVTGEFADYLPGFFNLIVAMPDSEMEDLLLRTDKLVPALGRAKAETLLNTNPLATWLDYCLIHDPETRTQIGLAKPSKDKDSGASYLFVNQWLYPSYCEYSKSSGAKNPLGLQRFINLLDDLAKNQLKLEGVYRERGRDNKSYFKGLRIRRDGHDDDLPSPITGIFAEGLHRDCIGMCIGLESPQHRTSEDAEGILKKSENIAENIAEKNSENITDLHSEFGESPYAVDEPLQDKDLNPMQVPTQVPMQKIAPIESKTEESITSNQSQTKRTPRIFEVGDRVVINDFGGVFHGQRGVIVKSVNYSDRTGLVVKFDKAVSLVREQEFIAGTLMWIKPGIK